MSAQRPQPSEHGIERGGRASQPARKRRENGHGAQVEREIGKQSRDVVPPDGAHRMVPRIGYAEVVPEDGPANPEYANSLGRDCSSDSTIEDRAQHHGDDDDVERIGRERERIAVGPVDSNVRVPRASDGGSFGQEIDPFEPIRTRPVCDEASQRVAVPAADIKNAAIAEWQEIMAAEQLFDHRGAFALRGCNARVAGIPARGIPRLLVIGIDTADTPRFTLGSRGRSARSARATQAHVMSSIR